MKRSVLSKGLGFVCVVLLVAAVPLGRGRAFDGPTPPAVVSYYAVSPCAGQIADKNMSTLTWYSETDEFYFSTGYPDSIWVNFPVNLPHNASVQGITVFFLDNGSGADEELNFYLQRHKMADGTTQTMATATTAGLPVSASRRFASDTSIDYKTVDNFAYTYCLVVRFRAGTSNMKFHGARIKYTVPAS